MDPLPGFDIATLEAQFQAEEKELLPTIRQELKTQVQSNLDSLKEKLRSNEVKPLGDFSQSFKDNIKDKVHTLIEASQKTLKTDKTLQTMNSINEKINNIEKLIFYVRYFNNDNTESYKKLVLSKGTKMNAIAYTFNNIIEFWLRDLVKNIRVDAKNLLNYLISSPEPTLTNPPLSLITTRVPKEASESINIDALTQIEYYYFNKTLVSITKIFEELGKPELNAKLSQVIEEITGSKPDTSESQKPTQPIENNPVLARLEKELNRIESISTEEDLISYLAESKEDLDRAIAEATNQETDPSKRRISDIIKQKPSNEEPSSDIISIDKIDSAIAQYVTKYSFLSNRKSLTSFLDDFETQVRQEALNILTSEKYLVQAAYIPIYFEEKFVVFHQGTGDFATENFAKMIQDFCSLAVKEFKKLDNKKGEFGFHPIYFCYVSENEHDFYLVEYDPTNTKLRVYLTSAYMFSALYKHLTKLEINKLEKKSFCVTLLNFFDKDLGLEYRKCFFDPKINTSNDLVDDNVSDKLKYFVFVTIFLLRNSHHNHDMEISFTAGDFLTFFNYLADYQAIYLRHHNNKEPVPVVFESYYPFVDFRKPKQSFLLYHKHDESKGKGFISVRTTCLRDTNFFSYETIYLDDEKIQQELLRTDIIKFLKKNDTKSSLNFDGPSYLHTFLKKKLQVDGFVKIIDKKQGQTFHDLFASGDDGKKLSKIFDDSSKYSRIVVLFPCNSESKFLLMVTLCRRDRRLTVYTYTSNAMNFLQEQQPEKDAALKKFVFFLAEKFKLDPAKLTLQYVQCRSNEEIVLQYYKRHYFPYSTLLELDANTESQVLDITIEDFIEPFKVFLSLNVVENNLDMFKAYNLLYEDMTKKTWKVANLQTLWKYSEFIYALEAFAQKISEENLHHCLIAFNFLGMMGRKTYYLYFRRKEEEESKEAGNKAPPKKGPNSYLVDIYSLANNLTLDDKELMAQVYQFCLTSYEPRFIYNAAYKISSKNNILLYNQVEITLSTLCYLVHSQGLSIERAFQKVSQSIVSHYEILENLMEQTKISNGQRPDSSESPSIITSTGVRNFKTHNTLFEETVEEMEYKKKLEGEVASLLDRLKSKQKESSELNIFLNVLNCEDLTVPSYSYVFDDTVGRKIILNEGNFLLDKETYANILHDLNAQKARYEEALNVIYPETAIFLIMPHSHVNSSRIPLIKYSLSKRTCIYYYLQTDSIPKLNENVLKFIETLDSVYMDSVQLDEVLKFEILPFEVKTNKEIESLLTTQYDLIIKFLIYLFNRQTSVRDDNIEIDCNTFNSFLCEYAGDLFGHQIEKSLVRENYKTLSNLFLQPNSPITKKPSLLTFLNGTATIEQLQIINSCIQSFKSDFRRSQNLENAFFCFNVSIKTSIKHFLLHLYGKDRKNMTLKIFTNGVGDSDAILDRMILTYASEGDTLNDNQSQPIAITNLSIYKIDIPNKLFTKYLEISSFLLAHAVCNDMRDSNEICGELTSSPAHFLTELYNVEAKCHELGIFKGSK